MRRGRGAAPVECDGWRHLLTYMAKEARNTMKRQWGVSRHFCTLSSTFFQEAGGVTQGAARNVSAFCIS